MTAKKSIGWSRKNGRVNFRDKMMKISKCVFESSFIRYGCLKDSFVRYGCLKDVFCTLWMSQRRLLYVMDVSKTSFCMLWMSHRHLLYVMDVSKTSFVRYGYLKDVLGTSFVY